MKKYAGLSAVIITGLILAMSLSGCFKSPTDPYSGGSSGSTAGITANNTDTTTTGISATASQVTTSGVYLSVVNQTGNPIQSSYFKGANYQVTYNGSAIPSGSIRLSTASGSGQAISSSLVLDYSGSMSSDIANLETAAGTFVNNMQAADRGEIIKFGTTVVREQIYTADKTALHTAITRATSASGVTSLYDATYMGITDTARETGQRAVIAFTDGYENNSTIITSQTALINAAKANGVPIFTVGLGSADSTGLQAIASQTGGFYYSAPTSAQLAAIYSQIAQVFNNTVILSWPGFTYQSGATITITITYICASGTYTSSVNVILP
jgi:hypothetical protein